MVKDDVVSRNTKKSRRSDTYHLKMNQRGGITLPKKLRQGVPDGSFFEATVRDDGVIELRSKLAIDATQSWFWEEKWQLMERETEADISAGRIRQYPDAGSFLADLDQ